MSGSTRDERTILHSANRSLDANIGVACGISGIAVVDVDVQHEHDIDALPVDLDAPNITRTGNGSRRASPSGVT